MPERGCHNSSPMSPRRTFNNSFAADMFPMISHLCFTNLLPKQCCFSTTNTTIHCCFLQSSRLFSYLILASTVLCEPWPPLQQKPIQLYHLPFASTFSFSALANHSLHLPASHSTYFIRKNKHTVLPCLCMFSAITFEPSNRFS